MTNPTNDLAERTDVLSGPFNPPPPPPRPADPGAALDGNLTPDQQRIVLGRLYQAALDYVGGGAVEDWAQTAHNLVSTVHLRGFKEYRDSMGRAARS